MRHGQFVYQTEKERISTHTPHTGCDHLQRLLSLVDINFNSHTPHGVRHFGRFSIWNWCHFNSHTPHGVRLEVSNVLSMSLRISTHTPHTGCDSLANFLFNSAIISTHTPHTGCDIEPRKDLEIWKISTHTPHTGCDPNGEIKPMRNAKFQLTHPTRGATPMLNGTTSP